MSAGRDEERLQLVTNILSFVLIYLNQWWIIFWTMNGSKSTMKTRWKFKCLPINHLCYLKDFILQNLKLDSYWQNHYQAQQCYNNSYDKYNIGKILQRNRIDHWIIFYIQTVYIALLYKLFHLKHLKGSEDKIIKFMKKICTLSKETNGLI